MRILPSVVGLLLSSTLPLAPADLLPSGFERGYGLIQEKDLRADLTFLASDQLEGRLSLTRGSETAVQWIASEFAKASLKPLATGPDGQPSYLQRVPLWQFLTDRSNSGITIHQSVGDKSFVSPDAFGSFPQNISLTAPVVFAGYGITAPELHYDDYANLEVAGKIVLVFDHEPQETDAHSIFNGKGSTRYAITRVKALNAQSHGAVALLVVGEPNRKHVSNQERLAKITGTSSRRRIPSEAIIGDELHIPSMTISDAIAAQLLAPLGSPSTLQTAIDQNLSNHSGLLPATTATIHMSNTESVQLQSYNVVGLLEGSNPALAPETVLISGHFDHDGEDGKNIWHGADDNGSGTVGVVELARAFSANSTKPQRSLLFVVFAAEERGLLGSYFYVQHPLRPLATTRATINFDMIGRNETPSEQTNGAIEIAPDTSNELNLIGTNYAPDYRRTVVEANKTVGLNLNYKWDAESSLNVFFRSDQFPFALHGIPAIWWFTGFHPDYHQTTDTADKINYTKMAQILRLAYLSAIDFCNEAKTPRFEPNPAAL